MAHQSTAIMAMAISLLFIHNDVQAFQIPLSAQHDRHSPHLLNPERNNELHVPSLTRRRRRAKLHDCASTSSCLHLAIQEHNGDIIRNENDDESYTLLLKQFMEDYAQDAFTELQALNQESILHSSSSSSGAMVATIAAPPIAEHPQEKSQLDGRDEGDLWRARGLLIGAAALYGTNFSLVKLLGDTMPVGISTSLRFGLAALATLPWLMDSKLWKSKSAQAAAWLGLEVGMWNAIGYVAQAVGLETTLASKSAFICSMAVVIVPLLEFMTGKKLQTRQWIGAVMALVGVAFLELGGAGGFSEAISSLTMGDGLSMIQPLVFGIGFWKMEKAMHRFPEEAQRLTAAQLMAVFMGSAVYGVWSMSDAAVAADTSFSLSTVANAYPWMEWLTDPSVLFSLFWTGCITTALTIYMETMALETLSATETTLIFSTEPLWGTAFAAAVMGEQLGMNAAVGAFFILTACVYSNLGLDGLSNSWKSSTAWLKQTMSGKRADGSPQTPLWRSMQEKLTWGASSFATSLATWNIATTNLNPQELNEIVDDLLDKLSL